MLLFCFELMVYCSCQALWATPGTCAIEKRFCCCCCCYFCLGFFLFVCLFLGGCSFVSLLFYFVTRNANYLAENKWRCIHPLNSPIGALTQSLCDFTSHHTWRQDFKMFSTSRPQKMFSTQHGHWIHPSGHCPQNALLFLIMLLAQSFSPYSCVAYCSIASHTKTILPTRKSVPRSSRQSDHTKTSWPS